MLTGVFASLFGLGFLLHSFSMVFVWTPAFMLMNAIELKRVEEPELDLSWGGRESKLDLARKFSGESPDRLQGRPN